MLASLLTDAWVYLDVAGIVAMLALIVHSVRRYKAAPAFVVREPGLETRPFEDEEEPRVEEVDLEAGEPAEEGTAPSAEAEPEAVEA